MRDKNWIGPTAELQYAERDIIGQGDYYIRHVEHVTSEDLHSKPAICAELAHRDIRIAHLEAENERLSEVGLVVGYYEHDSDKHTSCGSGECWQSRDEIISGTIFDGVRLEVVLRPAQSTEQE